MYVKKYINSLYNGLKSAQFLIGKKTANQEYFFEELIKTTIEIQNNEGRLFFFGNGASASFSNHMALDWSKNGKVNSISLSDSAMITALANDYDYKDIFIEFLKINKPNKNDLVITTSSSGNSPNIVNVLDFCKQKKIKTLALSGLNINNKSVLISDFSIFIDMKTYGMVECIHQVFHHIWLDKFMNIYEWDRLDSQNMNIKNFNL